MIKLSHLVDEYFLPEGLMITHNIDTAVNMVRKWFPKLTVKSAGDKSSFLVSGMENLEDVDSEYDGLIKMTNNLGWFPASMISIPNNPELKLTTVMTLHRFDPIKSKRWLDNKWLSHLSFEPKYDPQLSQDDIPNVGYHLSTTSKEEKILRLGLAPKSKQKVSSHPERIYLTDTEESSKDLLRSSAFRKNNTEFTLFRIDLKSFSQTRIARFFPDLNYVPHGFYTYENIPPKFVEVTERIKIG